MVQAHADGRYVIVAGHRRVAAYRLLAGVNGAKWRSIPALVRSGLNDAQLASLAYTENVARSALTPVEEGRALQAMVDRGLAQTNEDLAELVQRPVARIKRLRRLINGPRVIRKALAGNWSVRRCESVVDATIADREPESITDSAPVHAALFMETKRRFVVDLSLAASASVDQLAEVRAAFERALTSEQGQR